MEALSVEVKNASDAWRRDPESDSTSQMVRQALLAVCENVQDTIVDVDAVMDLLRSSNIVQDTQCQYMFCDVIAILWAELEVVDRESSLEQKKALASLLNEMKQAGIIAADLSQRALEPTLLQASGIISNAEVFRKRDIIHRTGRLYTQKKFNLLREESEGFAKLVTELKKFSANGSRENVAVLNSRIQCLVGYFDLDPNRVLDIILDSFECHPDCLGFIDVIGNFKADTVCQILGFKFRSYLRGDAKNTPDSLFKLAAAMIKLGKFNVDRIYAHLGPHDQDIVKLRGEVDQKQRDIAKSFSVVNLNAQQTPEDAAARDSPYPKPDTVPFDDVNQKFGLLKALIEQGDWTNANWIFKCLEKAVPASNPGVSSALCTALHAFLQPAYCSLAGFSMLSSRPLQEPLPDTAILKLVQEALPILNHLGIFMFRDVVLFSKVCRVLKHLLHHHKAGSELRTEIASVVDTLLLGSLLPSFSLIPSMCGISQDLWHVFREFDYVERYKYYGFWKDAIYDRYPELVLVKEQTIKSTKYFRKRVATGKIKEIGRQLVRFSHNNPLVVMQLILQQIQSYSNMGAVVVDSFKYASNMTLDIVVYTMLDQMSESRGKLKGDGMNVADWFQSLCSFCGAFFRKYPEVELAGVIQYVINQLKDGHSLDLLILKELITNMSSVVVLESMSDVQLISMAGSKSLREVTLESHQTKTRVKRNVPFLLDVLKKRKFILPLFVLISQQKRAIAHESDEPHLALTSELADKCQDILMHFLVFLNFYLDTSKLAAQMPPLEELVNKYNLSASAAFFIARPILAASAPSSAKASPRVANGTDGVSIDDAMDMRDDAEVVVDDDMSAVEAPLVQICRRFIPPSSWEAISPSMYADFWSMSLYDICVPKEQYELASKRLMDRIGKPEAGGRKSKDSELKRTIEKLADDLKAQDGNHTVVMNRLQKMKDTWLQECSDHDATGSAFLEHCILPRCLASAADSIYCAKFVALLHDLGTQGFSTISFHAELFKVVTSTLSSASENEASRFGRFFAEILQFLHRFANSEIAYKENFVDLPGSAVFVSDPDKGHVQFGQFCAFISRWHNKLSTHLCQCLSSEDRVLVRNALLFQAKIGSEFPRYFSHGEQFLELLDLQVKQHESGSSLKVLSVRAHAQLAARKASWIADEPTPSKESAKPRPKIKRPAPSPAGSRGTSPGPTLPSTSSPSPALSAVKEVPAEVAPAAVAKEDANDTRLKEATKVPKDLKEEPVGKPPMSSPPSRTDERADETAKPESSSKSARRGSKQESKTEGDKSKQELKSGRGRSRGANHQDSKGDQSADSPEERPAKRRRGSGRVQNNGDQSSKEATNKSSSKEKESDREKEKESGRSTRSNSRSRTDDKDRSRRGSKDIPSEGLRSRDRDRDRGKAERQPDRERGQNDRNRPKADRDQSTQDRDRGQAEDRGRGASGRGGRGPSDRVRASSDRDRGQSPRDQVQADRDRKPDRDQAGAQSDRDKAKADRDMSQSERPPKADRDQAASDRSGDRSKAADRHQAQQDRPKTSDRGGGQGPQDRDRGPAQARGGRGQADRPSGSDRDRDSQPERSSDRDRGRDRDRDRDRRGDGHPDKRDSSVSADRDAHGHDPKKTRIDRRLFSAKFTPPESDSTPPSRPRPRGSRSGGDDKRDKRRRNRRN